METTNTLFSQESYGPKEALGRAPCSEGEVILGAPEEFTQKHKEASERRKGNNPSCSRRSSPAADASANPPAQRVAEQSHLESAACQWEGTYTMPHSRSYQSSVRPCCAVRFIWDTQSVTKLAGLLSSSDPAHHLEKTRKHGFCIQTFRIVRVSTLALVGACVLCASGGGRKGKEISDAYYHHCESYWYGIRTDVWITYNVALREGDAPERELSLFRGAEIKNPPSSFLCSAAEAMGIVDQLCDARGLKELEAVTLESQGCRMSVCDVGISVERCRLSPISPFQLMDPIRQAIRWQLSSGSQQESVMGTLKAAGLLGHRSHTAGIGLSKAPPESEHISAIVST
ncbi:unnamed protein product [Pleuronectes platessa]|uniref:Uncharacterized protein n=1 Tax=Pleuronectes platessa TaxID=8262 RepID=A0A9N7UMQ3_PLEPL|nr:unnamed protein product [Pleuronectes platessa]